MIAKARVLRSSNGIAEVNILRGAACGETCGKACGTCGLKVMKTKATDSFGVKEDDFVEIESDSKKIIGLAFILYIIPLITGVLGYFLGEFIKKSEDFGALFALIFFIIGFIPAVIANKKNNVSYRIIRVIADERA